MQQEEKNRTARTIGILGVAIAIVVLILVVVGWGDRAEYSDNLGDDTSEITEYHLPEEVGQDAATNSDTKENDVTTEMTTQETESTIQEEKTVDYANGTCGKNLEWALSVDGQLTITGYGDMYAYSYDDDVPWHEFRDMVIDVVIGDGVTSVARYSFLGCENLKSVKLPNTVEKIGAKAFRMCESLESISLPDAIKEIPESAFFGCTSLKNVKLPSELRMIQAWAFEECVSLTSIELPQKLELISDNVFEDCSGLIEAELPKSLRSLGIEAFAGCENLRRINIPAAVDGVYSAFLGCSNLEEVHFEGDAPNISTNSFYGVSATCYYPKGNKTWTISKMSDYGGKLNWVGE